MNNKPFIERGTFGKVDKLIRIACKGSHTLSIVYLQPFQGDLKVLTEENYQRLRKEIIERGFSEPIAIWQKRQSDGKWL